MFLQFDINNGGDNDMNQKKLALIDEQASPLQRLMWLYNADEPQRRTFENNICTFHIGNGYFLSVAHNLRIQSGFFRSIPLSLYQSEILPKLDGSQNRVMEQLYLTDEYTGKKYLANNDPNNLQTIAAILKQKRFDTRWVTMSEKGICRPHIIFQFRKNAFYDDVDLSRLIGSNMQFFDSDTHKYTFMLPVQLVEAFYGEDIALYKIVDTPPEVINKIPAIQVSYDFLGEDDTKLYCLQSSPGGPAGRLLNQAKMEGTLDHFGVFPDEIGGNYQFEGFRYLVKGYFRFGSSGAPYLTYDADAGRYMANAIQSEASGIQLSINNQREGNFQYINAIASPLYIVKDRLQHHLHISKDH